MSSIPRQIGKYQVLGVLGRGGMGVVYRAHDPEIDRVVAVKTILTAESHEEENLKARLRMEARSAGRLHHPNIVTIFDFGQQDDVAYIVMEYVEGINLGRAIETRRPIALQKKLDILIQICSGLGYAHELNVIHRDMKPSNVCVTSKDVAKILDFGLARFDTTKLTKTGFLSGTIAYMSPERFNGDTGASDDIFATGAIAYELLTYRRAFPGGSPPEVMMRILSPDLPPPPSTVADLPPSLDQVVLKAVAKNRDERYSSAEEFGAALQELRHSAEFREFVADPERQKSYAAESAGWVEPQDTSVSPYSLATGQMREPEADPTVALDAPATVIRTSPATKVSGPSTDPDVTKYEAAPTVVVAQPGAAPTRKSMALPIAAGIAVLAIGGFATFRMLRQPTAPQVTVAPPATVGQTPAPDDVERQRIVLATLVTEVGRLPLSADQRVKFAGAQANSTLAQQKMQQSDYPAASKLMASAISEMEGLLRDLNAPPPQIPVTAAATPERMTTVAEKMGRPSIQQQAPPPITFGAGQPLEASTPKPIAVSTPEPRPAVEATPTPAPARPAEDPRREIRAFMQRVAAAYQERDADFFRENYANYTEQLGRAIRTSPRARVEFQIGEINVVDPSRATVTVTRTDRFADRNAPEGVQNLTFRLQKDGDGWRIMSFERR
jgi:serine/threonine protein kinase